jgi:hypothetical protein
LNRQDTKGVEDEKILNRQDRQARQEIQRMNGAERIVKRISSFVLPGFPGSLGALGGSELLLLASWRLI